MKSSSPSNVTALSDSMIPDHPQVASIRGSRKTMEDHFVTLRVDRKKADGSHNHGWLLAVMDGHGGPEVSLAAKDQLPHAFHCAFKQCHGNELETLRMTINLLNENPLIKYQLSAGSTVSVAYVLADHSRVAIAHLGDSPVIVFDHTGAILYRTEEHNIITNPMEMSQAVALSMQRHGEDRIKAYERVHSNGEKTPHYIKDRRMESDFDAMFNEILDQIERARTSDGGQYTFADMESDSRILAKIMKGRGLQNTAQLGAYPFDAILSREPDVEMVDIAPSALPAYVLLASDGILDIHPGASVMDIEQELAMAVAINKANPSALVSRAGDANAPDNTTLILYKICQQRSG